MAKPPTALRQWVQLRKNLSTSSPLNVLQTTSNSRAPTLTRTSIQSRPFSSTPKPNGTPAPAAELARRQKLRRLRREGAFIKSGQQDFLVDDRGLFLGSLEHYKVDYVGTEQSLMLQHDKVAKWQYAAGVRDGFIPKGISEKKFYDVGKELIQAAFESPPNGQAIRAISTDVDAVFRLGFMASIEHKLLRGWIVSSCALARSSMAVVTIARGQVTDTEVPAPGKNSWLVETEKLANEGYPPAMLLQAKIIGARGDLEGALEILEKKIMPFLTPSQRRPIAFEDITLNGLLPSPYQLQAVILAAMGQKLDSQAHRDAADKALAIAATQYNDVQALLDYACLMMSQDKLDVYEECMSKAATAGNPKACLYLANYYYLTYMGRYPTQAEQRPTRDNPHPVANWEPISPSEESNKPTELTTWGLKYYLSYFKNLFRASMSRSEYYTLSRDWYQLAYHHGEHRAAFMAALIDRELGLMHNGRMFLEQAQMQHDPLYREKLEELKNRWFDKDFEPAVMLKMLPVQ
ncbi:uncharacterized protein N7483_008039 [Penicillium malachiteum]|uniref:uncharacterized protein n=1 Tax=Penicillium malachiteum TaxID=1324776 RepID=UPI0025497648|nr:uncharacterized protein N7483_008039 [Penicillium malachiteum]KAJ5726682.1 hypothetical protein N7483_008039 [Penicillium malachiteum]